MASLGLVLGGGGVLGIAWEIGVLAALRDAGIDPLGRTAVVVGTSAGSFVGARLGGGGPGDLEAEQRQPAADSGPDVMAQLDYELLADIFVRWTSPVRMTEEIARECGQLSVKQSTITEDAFLGLIAGTLGHTRWPERELRIVTSSCTTGRRTVWTRTQDVALERAVAASCAIPGILPPITVDPSTGERFCDGGLWSGTNADLLADDGLDAVLVIEPLSASTNQLGEFSARALAAEMDVLRAAGSEVIVIAAGAAYSELTIALMDPVKRPEALAIGRADGTAAAASVAELLSGATPTRAAS